MICLKCLKNFKSCGGIFANAVLICKKIGRRTCCKFLSDKFKNSFYQEVQDTYVLYGIIEFVKICTVKIILVLIINW